MSTNSSGKRSKADGTATAVPQIRLSLEGAEALLEELDNPRTPRRLMERAHKRRGVIWHAPDQEDS